MVRSPEGSYDGRALELGPGLKVGAMSPWTTLPVLLSTVLLCASTSADGQVPTDIFPYQLTTDATWATGCIPPCLCPVLFSEDFEGTFSSEFTGLVGTVQVHAITDVEWTLNGLPAYTGFGSWSRDELLSQQRLELTLTEPTGDVTDFDSDWVPWVPGAPGPAEPLDIVISMNGFVCFDTWLHVVAEPVEIPFLRGDCNLDQAVNVADVVTLLDGLFAAQSPVACIDACDTNDDGQFNIADAITELGHLFGGTGPLPEPSSSCGVDPTVDPLGCGLFTACP